MSADTWHAIAHNEDWSETRFSAGNPNAVINWAIDKSRLEYVDFVTVTSRVNMRVQVYKEGAEIRRTA